MILLVDNYDSFVYNLRRYFIRLGQSVEVARNDSIDFAAVEAGKYKAIVISPGPKGPDQAGDCLKLVSQTKQRLPILGICLGHQILWQAFGGNVIRANEPMHGRACDVFITMQSELFAGLPHPFSAARYHSLVVDPQHRPRELNITATTHDGVVMAFEHQSLPLFGLQFHPESILTEMGYRLLRNYLAIAIRDATLAMPDDNNGLPSSDLVTSVGDDKSNDDWPAADDQHDGPAFAVIPGMAW
jgi:anthranilate synthase component II